MSEKLFIIDLSPTSRHYVHCSTYNVFIGNTACVFVSDFYFAKSVSFEYGILLLMCVMKFMSFGRRLKTTVFVTVCRTNRRYSTQQGYVSTGMLLHLCMNLNHNLTLCLCI